MPLIRRPSLRARTIPAQAGQWARIMASIDARSFAELVDEARATRERARALQAEAKELRTTAALLREKLRRSP